MPKRANKVKFGLSNVHYALLTTDESGGVVFGTPKHIPGAVSLALSAQGDVHKFHADDVEYYVSEGNSGYEGTLEFALIPDYFLQEVLGETLDETDKVLVENSSVEPKPFALLFEMKGNEHGTRKLLYNCTSGRPDINAETTTETKEPQTMTLSITASPLASGDVKAQTTATTPDDVYNSWYEKVWMPRAEVS